jgi:hypothetical protein
MPMIVLDVLISLGTRHCLLVSDAMQSLMGYM